ncbi:uncharacterized protein LOC144439775 isoform X2 [Glandiceps talaboti]
MTEPLTVDTGVTMSTEHTEFLDRVLGAIYGNCIGDAIGLLTEFMSKEEATYWYGKKEKLTYKLKEVLQHQCHQSRWKTGDWTDDSDQMILILQSLLENEGKVMPTDFAKKMRKWANEGFRELGDTGGLGIGMTTYKVIRDKKFIRNPHQVAFDVWDASGRYLAPNGALMRTSILGIHEYEDIDKVIENTLDMCKTTHADPRCQASCVALTTAIAIILQGKRHRGINGEVVVTGVIEDSFHHAKNLLKEEEERNELFQYMNISDIKELELDEHDKIGYTYKCLGAAFWAFKQDDFEKALTAIVREAGDADTNGAVAGALLGCKLGNTKLPPSWRDELLYKKWLDEKIMRFIKMLKIPEDASASDLSKMEEDSPNESKNGDELMEVDGENRNDNRKDTTGAQSSASDQLKEPEPQGRIGGNVDGLKEGQEKMEQDKPNEETVQSKPNEGKKDSEEEIEKEKEKREAERKEESDNRPQDQSDTIPSSDTSAADETVSQSEVKVNINTNTKDDTKKSKSAGEGESITTAKKVEAQKPSENQGDQDATDIGTSKGETQKSKGEDDTNADTSKGETQESKGEGETESQPEMEVDNEKPETPDGSTGTAV